MKTNPSLVDRFFHVLVQEIRRGVPNYLKSSFTVAEIYQTLVPYRTHRDRIGAEMNGEYEDALLRLLAGEGDYLILESDPARQRLQREVDAPNPNTGIYREFAAVGVRLNPRRVPEVSSRPEQAVRQETLGQGALVSDEELDALVGRALDSADEELRLDALLGQALGTGPRTTTSTGRDPGRGEASRQDPTPVSPATGRESRPDPEPKSASDQGYLRERPGHVERKPPSREEVAAAPEAEEEPASTGQPAPVDSRGTGETGVKDGKPESQGSTGSDPEETEEGAPAQPQRIMEIPGGVKLGSPPDACPECDADLPERDNLRFCPFCGTNVFLFPCRSCEEVLERGWNYCFACGTAVE